VCLHLFPTECPTTMATTMENRTEEGRLTTLEFDLPTFEKPVGADRCRPVLSPLLMHNLLYATPSHLVCLTIKPVCVCRCIQHHVTLCV
jgi:hypothetical protein